MGTTKVNFKYLIFITSVSAMGGFLFGYDWVVIGGAKPFYELYFEIVDTPILQGWAMSSALVGCIFGAILSGLLADKWGRKSSLILAGVLFIISAWGTGYADSFIPFIIYRIMGGLGIGLASTLSPMYIAEIAPAKYRGRFVAINQLTIVIGILTAQIVNWYIAETIPMHFIAADIYNSWNGQIGWRQMFWAELIPAGLFFILIFLVPESPRFLVKIGHDDTAFNVLDKIGGREYAINEIRSIKTTVHANMGRKVPISELKDKKVLSILG
ncbi:MAG TPA: MFS transporter, partial [Arenibacter sp.]|nr:MFS transporter [Arenibacter sp.]